MLRNFIEYPYVLMLKKSRILKVAHEGINQAISNFVDKHELFKMTDTETIFETFTRFTNL